MKPLKRLNRNPRHPLAVFWAFLGLAFFAGASALAVTPSQANYDVWAGNYLDSIQSYYNVDQMAGYVKLGSTNRTATFYGQYNYYVVAVKRTETLYLDAAQTSTGNYYNSGSLAVGNVGGTVNNAYGAPNGIYTTLLGPAAGSGSTAGYGSFIIFYNAGGWTSMKFFVYAPPLIPVIITQPVTQRVGAGSTVKLFGEAVGEPTLKYQWRKNGINLVNGGRVTGATSTNLSIASAQAADSGSYSVVVSNAYGSVTSAVAVLNVVTPPSSFVLLDYFNPLVEGNEWHYTGTDYAGQPSTRVDRVAKRDWPVTAYKGRSTPRTYTTNLVQFNRAYGFPTHDDWDDFYGDQGALAFWGHNDGSDSGRVDGGLVFPPSLNLGQSASVTRDFYDRGVYQGSVTFKLTAVSWGSVTVPAGTFEDCLKVRIVISGGGEAETQDEWWVRGVGAVKHRNVPDDGEEQLDLVRYNVVAPVRIVTPPRAQTNSLGGVATFAVVASGSPPLSYHWRKNNVDLAADARISGAASKLLVIAGLEFADAGSYSVRVANDHDSVVSSAAVLTVNDALPPVVNVTSHVESQLLGGANVTLAGTASDAGRGGNGIASVTVDGTRATNDTAAGNATANWSRMFNLVLGTNRITVVARDGRGNSATNIIRLLADTARPTASITVPAANARLSNAVATVQGKAGDNLGLVEVRYQLNGSGWTTATPSPTGWSNWRATLNLAPGANTLNAYAVDVAANRSLTNTVRFVYVLTAPLGVNIVGNGKVNGAVNGQLFEIGKSVAPTVTPATGWVLTNWLVQVDGNTIRSTNKAVPFLVASNTVVTARFVDVAKPTLTITAPKLNQRWSNEVFTVTGKVTDNNPAGEVKYQLNGGAWKTATGWTNWSASVNLIAGTNHVKAYAVDAAGNRSTTNSVNFVRVLTAPLSVAIIGSGKVNGVTDGQLFEIGKSVAPTVTPATGWILTNWLVQVDGNTIRATNKVVSFLMASNAVVTARFVDVAKPTLTITAPKLNQRWSNEVFTVTGKVTDNNPAGEVKYQLNGGAWKTATGWTNWSASVNLIAGTNHVKAYAVDAAGNRSTTNSVNFVRVLTAPLSVAIIGNGKVNGVTDGQLFEIGKSVAPTVTPATGWVLTNWLVTVDGNTIRSTNRVVPFLMASNTIVTAKFVDVAKPTLTITAPKLNQRWSNEVFTVAGKVTDNSPNGSVWYQLNSGAWTSASGWTNWSASVNLIAGTNHVKAYAVDAAGNRSTTNSGSVIYVLTYCLADYYYSAPLGSRLIYDGLDWDGFPAQLKVEIKDADHPLVTYSGTTTVSNYVVNVLHIESAYGTYISGTGQFFSNDDWDEYFIRGGCSFGWAGSDDDDESLRVDRFLITNRVAVGQTISITRGTYLDGSYAGQATLKLQLLDVSTVTVPAGTFPGCLRIRLTLSAGGESQTHDDWLAPGIGMVKQQGVSGDGAAERWELIRYLPPMPAPTPLAVNVAPATQTPLQWIVPDEAPAVADGQMQWRVAGRNGQAFVVEGSSDLRAWIPLHTNTIPAEGLLLSLPVGPQPAQFFRLRAVQP